MKKSTYSVVLSDRVVAEIDRLAYRKGTNRSSMINEILAGYVSMTTPEQRISRIFSDMAAVLYPGEVFRELAPPTPSVRIPIPAGTGSVKAPPLPLLRPSACNALRPRRAFATPTACRTLLCGPILPTTADVPSQPFGTAT